MSFRRSFFLSVVLLLATLVFAATAGAAGVAGSSVAKAWDVPSYASLSVKATTGPSETETEFREALEDNFAAMDTNSDGKVSFEEAAAYNSGLTQDVFYAVDANGDGFITKEEVEQGAGCAGCSSCSGCGTKKCLSDFFLAGLSISMLAAFSRRK
jgi:hypothetical protein